MNRTHTITQKIERSATGLNGALYAHIQFDARWRVDSVRFSHKAKDDSTLDNILEALGNAVTEIVRENRG